MRPEKIIVIDDDDFALFEKTSALSEIGFHNVESFINPVKFLDHVREHKPIDLLITDWQMNPVNGIELIEKLKENGELDFEVLLVSKADRPIDYQGHFLHKPAFTEDYMAKLKTYVQELLGSR